MLFILFALTLVPTFTAQQTVAANGAQPFSSSSFAARKSLCGLAAEMAETDGTQKLELAEERTKKVDAEELIEAFLAYLTEKSEENGEKLETENSGKSGELATNAFKKYLNQCALNEEQEKRVDELAISAFRKYARDQAAAVGDEEHDRQLDESAREAFKKFLAGTNFDVSHYIGNVSAFLEWLQADVENVKVLLKLFTFVSGLNEPLCFAAETLEGISTDLEGKERNQLLARVLKKAGKPAISSVTKSGQENKDTEDEEEMDEHFAFKFSAKGVKMARMGDMLECAQSLKYPLEAMRLLVEIWYGLQRSNANKFHRQVEHVFEYLVTGARKSANPVEEFVRRFTVAETRPAFGARMEKQVSQLNAKWLEVRAQYEPEGIRKRLQRFEAKVQEGLVKLGDEIKDVAIWLGEPTHVEEMIEILMYMTGVRSTFSIGMSVLSLFNLNTLFIQAVEKLGARVIAEGGDRELVMWWMGPNGLIPLFVRSGATTTDEMPIYTGKEELTFQNGTVFDHSVHKLNPLGDQDAVQLLTHVADEVVKRKGHPIQELIGATMAKLAKEEAKFRGWLKGLAQKAKTELQQAMGNGLSLSSVAGALKRFVVWFVTPARINQLVNLALSLTGLSTPIYLTLEVLDAVGVTDLLLKGFNAAEELLQKVNLFRTNKALNASLDFVIGENGLTALFLHDGQLTDGTIRSRRLSDEADLLKVFVNTVFKHQTDGWLQLYQLLVAKLQPKTLFLKLFQRFNKANRDMHAKYGDQIAENIVPEIVDQVEDKFAWLGPLNPVQWFANRDTDEEDQQQSIVPSSTQAPKL